jgi:diguanylate cyclase
MQNRDKSLLGHAARPTSRRLHRCLPFALVAPQVPACVVKPKLQRTLGLPQTVVREAGMLELVAAQMRISELEKSLAEARAAAMTDPLTGAFNRRGFAEHFERELARSLRSGCGLALALIDLDNFKCLNDTHGHQAGDEALVHLVRVLRAAMRPSDVLCRFGGEEFVLLLPDTSLADAEAAISRFRHEFATHPLPSYDCFLSFSAGVVAQTPTETLDALIGRADTATYAAKRAGKNCVIAA